MSSSIPPNETARLAALSEHEILDTLPEASFDRVTNLAAQIFVVPIALVTLVDQERQWFKSCVGLDIPGTERDAAFCAHTILSDAVLIVPDALVDPRFRDNRLVTGAPFIRFYAGAPLITSDGFRLGSLCLIDTVPRDFTAAQAAMLQSLAAMAMDLIEARRLASRLASEVSEHERAEARRQAVLDAALDAIITMDQAGTVIELNRAAESMFGYSAAQAVGQELAELIIPPALREAHRRGMAHLLATGEGPVLNKRLELSAVRSNGEEFPVELAITRIATEGPPIFTGHIRDITGRCRAEEEVRRAAQRVQTVLESITDAFYSLDREWRFTYVNEQAQRVLERPRADLLGRSFWEVFPYKAKMAYYSEFHRALETGQPAAFELYSAPLKKWLGVHAYPSDEGLSVYVQDITERKQAQKALEDNLGLLRAIIDGTDNHIFIKDVESRYLLINPAGAALFGTTSEAAVGKDDSAFFPPESVRANRASDAEIMASGKSRTYESSDVINGVEHVFLSTKSPYRDAAGNLLGVIGIAREITDQRSVAEALRAAKEEAERANAAKSEFLSRMSHELRTPLNAILGFGQLLEMSAQSERQRENVSHILKGGRHLLGLINEVLDISRIESGKIELSLEAVKVAELFNAAAALIQPLAAQRNVRIGRCMGAAANGALLADRQRLSQVVLNLLSNAVKYNRPGGTVSFSCEPGTKEGFLRLRVSDTGPGIAAADLGKLFTPFERLGAERSGIEGTGIGLALCKRLVEAMGGSIGAESTLGRGSAFSLELPTVTVSDDDLCLAIEQPGVSPSGSGAVQACTVLCIEDNLSNYSLIEQILEHERPNVRLLGSMQGRLGFDMAREHHPSLILLDLQLPDLPGDEVLRQLQADEDTRHIPVVMVSADATKGQARRLMDLGARAYLTKPLDSTLR